MSPRQRASPENLCRSRRRTWASPSSEGESSISTPGPSYCRGAGQRAHPPHSRSSFQPLAFPWWWMTHLYANAFCLEINCPASLGRLPGSLRPSSPTTLLLPTSHSSYLFLLPRTGPLAGCAVRPADCAAPAPSSRCASGPGKSQPLERAAWSNTRRPTAEKRSLVRWESGLATESPGPTDVQKDGDQRAPGVGVGSGRE